MIERRKMLILAIVVLFVFLVIPVTIFRKIITQYFFFLDLWIEAPSVTIKNKIISKIPQGHVSSMGDMKLPEFKFVKFEIKVNAKEVFIKGDFNKWTAVDSLVKKAEGSWEVEIPLVKGKYKYLFLIDGKEVLDPLNPDVDYYEEKKVSVIKVD